MLVPELRHFSLKMTRVPRYTGRAAYSNSRKQMRLRVALSMTLAFVGGCATSDQSSHKPGPPLEVSVISTTAGVRWGASSNAALVVKVSDIDGTNEVFSWSHEAQASTGRLPDLHACLSNLRMRLRFVDAASIAQPNFIRSQATQCFESSGMPTFASTREPHTTDFYVQFSTGNVNGGVQREPGILMSTSGGPHLGARRRIRARTSIYLTVAKDVKGCSDSAAAEGVFATNRLTVGTDSSGWQTTSTTTSIQPMLDRFDQCLRGLDYIVESAED
jgi:hypothetical protein